MGFATDILTRTDAVILGYTSGAWSAIVSSHMGAIRAAAILYIATYGWCVLNNWIETTLSDAWKHVLKMAIVFAVVTTWGWFHMFFYGVSSVRLKVEQKQLVIDGKWNHLGGIGLQGA